VNFLVVAFHFAVDVRQSARATPATHAFTVDAIAAIGGAVWARGTHVHGANVVNGAPAAGRGGGGAGCFGRRAGT